MAPIFPLRVVSTHALFLTPIVCTCFLLSNFYLQLLSLLPPSHYIRDLLASTPRPDFMPTHVAYRFAVKGAIISSSRFSFSTHRLSLETADSQHIWGHLFLPAPRSSQLSRCISRLTSSECLLLHTGNEDHQCPQAPED